jgi:hypothetical protein
MSAMGRKRTLLLSCDWHSLAVVVHELSGGENMLLTTFSLMIVAPATGQSAHLPRVAFVHARLLEGYCGQVSAAKPDPAAVEEVTRRLPEFQAAWDRDGPELMRATVDVSGIQYRFSERSYDLHACPDMSSMSSPPILAVARYTHAAGAGAESGLVRRAVDAGEKWAKLPPRPMSDFVYTVWHELAHKHVVDALGFAPGQRPAETPILKKYAAEPPTVRWHLHLFAIEKLALRKLGRETEYAARYERLKQSGYKNYIRAREIVESEGAEAIVADLQTLKLK